MHREFELCAFAHVPKDKKRKYMLSVSYCVSAAGRKANEKKHVAKKTTLTSHRLVLRALAGLDLAFE